MARLLVLASAVWLCLAACGDDAGQPAIVSGTATTVSSSEAEWKAYESSLGFTIRYPSSWRVDEEEVGLGPGGAKILNEKRQLQTAAEGGDSGEAWIQISLDSVSPFDVVALSRSCESGDHSVVQTADETTLAGLRAVRCTGRGTDVYSRLPLETELYLVELPNSGGVLDIITYAVDTDETARDLLNSILATIAFEAE